jgi:cyclase
MLILPAIDIINGGCVRLTKGNYSEVSKYSLKPIDAAKKFINEGATFLHIVDLDGAKIGRPVNYKQIFEIAKDLKIDVQVGGGIRKYTDAKFLLENGVRRVVLGTSFVEKPALISRLTKEFGNDRIAISLDLKNGKLMTKGWNKNNLINIPDIIDLLKKLQIVYVIITDVEKDGMLEGPNLKNINIFVKSGFKVIVAGGVTSKNDIDNAEKAFAYGCIIGKALYEGKIELRQCFKNNLAKRIIPCMDIDNWRVVKGINFQNLKDAGDPVALAKFYSEMGADELIFLDITATIEKRKTFCSLVSKIAENINIPFTVGGGIRSLEDVSRLLNSGADKVAICSYALTNPEFVKEVATKFGAQCVVISIDAKKTEKGWEVYINGGRINTKIDVVEFAKEMQKLGAGEILLNSLDSDGTKKGYDVELLKAVSSAVNLPIIASSGAGSEEDFLKAFRDGGADAALAASLFHSKKLLITDLKKYLLKNNVTIRI